jgi:hypothetical protein
VAIAKRWVDIAKTRVKIAMPPRMQSFTTEREKLFLELVFFYLTLVFYNSLPLVERSSLI